MHDILGWPTGQVTKIVAVILSFFTVQVPWQVTVQVDLSQTTSEAEPTTTVQVPSRHTALHPRPQVKLHDELLVQTRSLGQLSPQVSMQLIGGMHEQPPAGAPV